MAKITTDLQPIQSDQLYHTEWLITNGLGGYACYSLSCAPMRKYHSYLLAALSSPHGRCVMLNYIADVLILKDKREFPLSLLITDPEKKDRLNHLKRFRIEDGIPFWTYEIEDIILEKSVLLIHNQNTVHINYKVLQGNDALELRWRPYFHFRTKDDEINTEHKLEQYVLNVRENQYEISYAPFPSLHLTNCTGALFTNEPHKLENIYYEIEHKRGYPSTGDLISLGSFLQKLDTVHNFTFIASVEPWKYIQVLNYDEALALEKRRVRNILKTAGKISETKIGAKLTLAADQFVMTPTIREEDFVRLEAAGEEARSVLAGFPWFTDWGRDTMISLEGMTLTTNRFAIAACILRTFTFYVKDGLIPNMFESEQRAAYNTADATLWFFHAIERYIEYSGDTDILEFILPKLYQIVEHHLKGTRFGIRVDSDGLLTQGQEDVALTWMDAKKDQWIVTPRRGKAVEINALWYNALRLMEAWSGQYKEQADQCYESFNRKFWFDQGKYLYDVIDENDTALRPNQLIAISLKHPVLEKGRWASVLEAVEKSLLTPYGLRTLSPSHPDYKPYYEGDLLARDSAYHQGTVWPWLIGPFVDVWLKVYPGDVENVKKFLLGLENHIDQYCCGTLGEIFDANDPHHARGCFAQAWSVAEFLRCYAKTI